MSRLPSDDQIAWFSVPGPDANGLGLPPRTLSYNQTSKFPLILREKAIVVWSGEILGSPTSPDMSRSPAGLPSRSTHTKWLLKPPLWPKATKPFMEADQPGPVTKMIQRSLRLRP